MSMEFGPVPTCRLQAVARSVASAPIRLAGVHAKENCRRNAVALLAVATAALLATPSSAASVSYTMGTVGNNWTLSVRASLGDNFGIARYSVPLAGGITSLNHRTPLTAFAIGPGGTSGPAGFTAMRTPNSSLFLVSAAIDTTPVKPPIIRGFGQEASSFAAKEITALAPVNGDNPWSKQLVIASGTWAGTIPTILNNDDLNIGVFREATGIATGAASIFGLDGLNVVLNALGERDPAAGLITAPLLYKGSDFPFDWTNLTQTLGPPVAIAATIEGGRTFSWNPAGSQTGSKGSGTVKYQWTATVTNFIDSDTNVAIEVILIPEPTTLPLIGSAVIGLIGVIRRRGVESL